MEKQTEKKVSIIIPTFNRRKILNETINHLLKQDYPDFEIIVITQVYNVDIVNNPCVKKYHLKKANLPNAKNYGVKKASGNIIIFLDDDIIPSDDFIKNHVDSINSEYSIVVGRIIDERGPGTRERVVQFNEKTSEYLTDFGKNECSEIISLAGGNSSFKRELFIKNKFDTFFNITSHWEEVDFAFRLRKIGYKILFQPKAEIHHLMQKNGGCRNMNSFLFHYSQFKNSTLFFLKQCKKRYLINFLIYQKNILEFQSRKQNGGHSKKMIMGFLFGINSGILFYVLELTVFRNRLVCKK